MTAALLFAVAVAARAGEPALTSYVAGEQESGPEISGVSGFLEQGSPLTLRGRGFGDGPDVVLFDDFERGEAGEPVPVGRRSRTRLGRWAHACGIDDCHPPYYDERHAVGRLAYVSDASKPDSSWRNDLIADLDMAREVLWYQWVYLPEDKDCIPDEDRHCKGYNWKQNWLLGPNDSPTASDRYGPWYSGTGENDGRSLRSRFGSNADEDSYGFEGYEFRSGRWVQHHIWVRGDPTDGGLGAWGIDAADDATFETWFFGEGLPNQDNDNPEYHTPFLGYHSLSIGGYASQNEFAPRYDDVYIARGPRARARVLLGNAGKLGDCSLVTLCTTGGEGDSWSGEAITCTVRRGRMDVDEPIWLFVVEGSGGISAGFGPIAWRTAS